MPIEAEIEGIGILEFPDGTSNDVIQSTAKRIISERAQPKAPETVSAMSAQYQAPQRTGDDPYASMFQAGSPQQLQSAVEDAGKIGEQKAIQGEAGQYVTPYFQRPGVMTAPPSVSLSEAEKKRAAEQLAISAGLVGSAVAPAFLPEALTTAATTGTLGTRLLAGGAVGGVSGATSGAFQAIPETLRGEYGEAAKTALRETAVGTVAGPVVSEVARPLIKAGTAAYELFLPGADRLRRFLGTALRPQVQRPKTLESEEIRNIIFESTGERVPLGVAEAIGSPEIANAMKSLVPKAEPSVEELEAVKRAVLFSASRLGNKNLGISSDDLATETINLLKKEIGAVSKPYEDAVKSVSKQLDSSIKKGFAEIENQFQTLIPGTTATPTTLGQNFRSNIQSGLKYLKDTDNANYGAVYANPAYEKLQTKNISNLKEVANEIDASAVQQLSATPEEALSIVDQFGFKIPSQELPKTVGIPSTYPEGTRGFVGAIGKMAPNQTIDSLRKLRTQIGNSIGDDTVLPGLGDRAKLQLYRAASNDISEAIDNLPTSTLKNQLQLADKFHRENVDNFAGKEIQSIIKEVGAEGGAGPASIALKLESADAPTFIEQLKKASNPSEASRIDSISKEFIFNQAGKSARDAVSGEVSIGKVINYIDGLAPELKKSYFPNFESIKSLAKRQSALQSLEKSADKISSSLTTDPRLLFEALGTEGKAVEDLISTAMKRSGEMEKAFRGTVLGALKKGSGAEITDAISQNPAKFVKTISDVDGPFSSSQTKVAFDLIGRENPELLNQLQFQYVDDLISRYSKNGVLDASSLASDLLPESAFGKAKSIKGYADAVLGSSRTDNIRSVVQNLSKMEKIRAPLTESDPFIEGVARGVGGVAGGVAGKAARIGTIGAANQANQIVKLVPRIRYKIAAKLLTTPELRYLAMKPIGQITKNEANAILRATTAAISAYEGDDSPDIDELQNLER